MNEFQDNIASLYEEIGPSRKMVLSTSLNDHVTSRMMSIIIMDGCFFFQTDKTFTKYKQLIGNNHVALCFQNMQIEGLCHEIGMPLECERFCELYQTHFKSSYDKYTSMENEILFRVEPTFIQKWIYEGEQPFVEQFDFCKCQYVKRIYQID